MTQNHMHLPMQWFLIRLVDVLLHMTKLEACAGCNREHFKTQNKTYLSMKCFPIRILEVALLMTRLGTRTGHSVVQWCMAVDDSLF
jgi:CTP-dependent riboflavin kinase